MATTVKWLDINEMFHTEICTSPLPNSPSPYWSIDGVPLVSVSERQRYGARVNYFNDIYGRYQADLTMSVNETFNGSNVSCIVASELGRVYILRIAGKCILRTHNIVNSHRNCTKISSMCLFVQ